MQRGVTLWFTGLSGAGKTTVCLEVARLLALRGVKAELLDGDEMRGQLTAGLGFSKEDRRKNTATAAYIARLLTRNGIIVLASFVSPYKSIRESARESIGSFAEVYVCCPLEECARRDVKGLYKKAFSGEIGQFTGVSDPFEPPEAPELVLHTDRETVDQCAARVVEFLETRGYIG
ncbi:adenylyl-sulfate kinase [Cohnella lubricantis]|uniref:Adenylyl-sulfate kinase n=1 Tax=Cohnella lubricantis TaxID=2163172 RepID=A0A841T716_9BACL|nr:adenylyl-sulfate kinase [Cohnella lubricantis]MBB6675909.1 adenylyl-sulfate kinase [Cohnella lubricantis]MBP2117174.1 adenylyl-sulfate kinase [Cohnella lubricantis]